MEELKKSINELVNKCTNLKTLWVIYDFVSHIIK